MLCRGGRWTVDKQAGVLDNIHFGTLPGGSRPLGTCATWGSFTALAAFRTLSVEFYGILGGRARWVALG